MNKKPLVSVIIPTYNYANYICEAIDSVIASTFPQDEIEIIIIDDGSKDNTSEKVAIYGNRVKYIFQKNSGKAFATKVGIENCNGKYIFNLDADDIFFPNKIQEVVKIFECDNDIVHVAHPALCWDVDENIKATEAVPDSIIGNKICGRELLTFFYKKRILFGGGSTFATRVDIVKNFHIPKEVDMFTDEYLVLFTLKQGYSFIIDEPLSIWRIHGKNFSESASKYDIAHSLRFLESNKAVLDCVLDNDFPDTVKQTYYLKTIVHEMIFKEKTEDKTLRDIFKLWCFILSNFSPFQHDTFAILQNHWVIPRSIPLPILRLLQSINAKYKLI